MTAAAPNPYPLAANGALYEPAQVDAYFAMLFEHVQWEPGQLVSLLGIGEKGTPQEGVLRDRQIMAPDSLGNAHRHLKRWAEWHGAGFIVPAVLNPAAAERGDVKLDMVDALTTILLDLDSGDVDAKAAFVISRLGQPTMTVASGGRTDAGKAKVHLYWRLTEPCEDVERVAALRKLLAAKVGGDQSFGRATQVVRVPGSVHAKNGQATVCRILERCDVDYDLDDLAETIESMLPMPGLPAPALQPALSIVGGMDFAPRQYTAINALHRDIAAGGDDLNRWGEFSKVAGFYIAEARGGRLKADAAFTAANGWMLAHMQPPWPQARFDQEFRALWNRDLAAHGPMPQTGVRAADGPGGELLPVEFFSDIQPCLTNKWLVRNLLVAQSLALIYGSPGAGKSFLALDISARIAAGWPVNGAAVKACPVVYVAAEGQGGVRDRLAAFRVHHDVAAATPFALIPTAINLLDPNADLPRLVATIEAVATARWSEAPGLIVVDTLAATFGAGDENTKDMVAYVNNLATLRDHFGATVMAVHHRPKDQQNNTPRGHSRLMGAMDTIIGVEALAGSRVAAVTKQKDAEPGEPIRFELVKVPLGVDEDGEPAGSAVVKYVVSVRREELPPQTKQVLAALESAIAASGGENASERDWRRAWEASAHELSDEARRKGFARGKANLLKVDAIKCEAGVWAIRASADVVASGALMDFRPPNGWG